MKKQAEVVVIGAGIMGASLAYFLAKHGKEVLVLEQNEICSGTSSSTAAWLWPTDKTPLHYGKLAWDGYNRYMTLAEELGADFELTITGGVEPLYTEEEVRAAEKTIQVAHSLGHPDVRIVSQKEVQEIEPILRHDILGAIVSPYEGHLNPFLLVNAYIQAAKRLGAENVYIVYRRGKEELPARAEEVFHAEEEGIEFKLLQNPTKILGNEDGWVSGMEVIKMELGEPDDSGRRRPVPIEGSEEVIDVDTVVVAIGQTPNPLIRKTTKGLDTNKRGCIIADEDTGKTSKDHVYAGGDVVTGAATVILAMGAGKAAAAAIDEELSK